MIKLQPVRALKTLFGYRDSAHPPKVPHGMDISDVPGGMVTVGEQSQSYAYYQKQMELATDRRQRYHEFELMDDDDVVAAALDIYAEDSTQPDSVSGKTIWVESKNSLVLDIGEELLENIEIEDQCTAFARELAKYGDSFSAIIQSRRDDGSPGSVIGLIPVDPKVIHRRHDDYGRLLGYTRGPMPDIGEQGGGSAEVAQPWEYLHARVLGRERRTQYGYSILSPARRMFRRLRMMEDAVVIYRLRRAPDRFVFAFKNLRGLSVEERFRVVNRARSEMRKHMLVDPQSGKVRSEINPLSIDEDLFIDSDLLSVDKIAGSERVGHVMDIEYMRKRFYGCLRIPPDYLGFEEAKGSSLTSHSPLSMQDTQVARTCKRIQKGVITAMVRLIKIEMCWRGIDPGLPDNQFSVHMVPISFIDEQNRNEAAKVRAETIELLQDIGSRLELNKEAWLDYIIKMSGFPIEVVEEPGRSVDIRGDVELTGSLSKEEKAAAIVESIIGRNLLRNNGKNGYLHSEDVYPDGVLPGVREEHQLLVD